MTDTPFINTTSGLGVNAGVVGTPGAITATSSTTQTIALGTLSFQVPAQAAWAPGMAVSMLDANNSANSMFGFVDSYSGTTLIVDVTAINGSGTYASWLINLSGNPSSAGPAGATGATGATGAAAGPINGAVQGLKIKNNASTPSTKIDITAVAATMVNTSGTSERALAVSVTINTATGNVTSAANGMDGEAPGTSAWLYLYLINNGMTTAGLATLTSPLSGTPTLPAGYTYYTYVGAMMVDGSGNLLRTEQYGKCSRYVVTSGSNTAALPTMANGSAGSTSSPTWVGITLAGFVPPTASQVLVAANGDSGGTPATVIAAPNNAYGNATSANPPPVATSGVANNSHIDPLPIESASIYWASSGTDGFLFCVGWDDYVVTA